MKFWDVIFITGRHTTRKCNNVSLNKCLVSLAFIRLQPQVILSVASFLKIDTSY